MILCFLKVIPMRFFSVVILLHAFKIESSLQKFCPGLFKSRWHGCFSIMHRDRSSLQRPVACDQTASGQLQNCVLIYPLSRSPLCLIPHVSVSQLHGILTPHLDHIQASGCSQGLRLLSFLPKSSSLSTSCSSEVSASWVHISRSLLATVFGCPLSLPAL